MVQQHPTMHLVKCGYIANEVILPRSLLADRIFGRSNIWPLRRTIHTGPANRLAAYESDLLWNLAGQVRERPRVNGIGRSNISTVLQRRCKYAIKRPLVNERLFLMSFRSKKVTSSLPLYVSHSLMDK